MAAKYPSDAASNQTTDEEDQSQPMQQDIDSQPIQQGKTFLLIQQDVDPQPMQQDMDPFEDKFQRLMEFSVYGRGYQLTFSIESSSRPSGEFVTSETERISHGNNLGS